MEAILTALIPLTFLLMLALERIFPARPLPRVKWWLLKGFVFFVITGAFNAILPAVIGPAVSAHAPLHLASLEPWRSWRSRACACQAAATGRRRR